MWFRGDRVELLTGPDKGKQGYINYIVQVSILYLIRIISSLIWFQERNWVTVEGLNVEYEKMGETKEFPGMMIKKELPLIVNRDISLVDPSTEEAGEVEWRFDEAGINSEKMKL